MRIESFHGTNPLFDGQEYHTYYQGNKIVGKLVQTQDVAFVYLTCKIQTITPREPMGPRDEVKIEHRTYLVHRLHVLPWYQLN